MTRAPLGELSLAMARAQEGDQIAYAGLLRAVAKVLRGYFQNRIGDHAQSEDLCQDVLLKIHAYRDTYDPAQKFESWMFAIASRTLIDYFRARGVRSRVTSFDATIEEMASTPADQHTAVVLKEAVAAMSDAERAIFERSKVDGIEPTELAKDLGTSVGAANVRSHRAMHTFLDGLDETTAAPEKRRDRKS